ncbi:PorV/PorQ family protein [Candidatus Poribacteria bacterium]|nr:PorV/PorQ family protein [Candidatus Poribacteria bacterium]
MLITTQIAKWASKQGPKLLCGLIPLFFLILAVTPVSFAGVDAMPHLRLGAGARSIGMGGAFTAIADDATATVWNPAGLGSAADLSLNFSTQQLDLDRSHNFIAVTKALGSAGSIGLAVTNAGVSGIQQYDARERYGGTFNYSANAYSLSYGIGLGNFGIGLTGRMLADNFGAEGVESQSGFGGVDVGLMGHALHIDVGEEKVPTFHYGIAAKYLGAALGEDTVPMVISVGAAYNLYMGNVVTFAADLEQEMVNLDESATSLRLGAEYTIVTYKSTALAIRGGVRASRDTQNLFGGFGVNIGGLQIDYAIQDGMASEINGVGSTHFASLSYRF